MANLGFEARCLHAKVAGANCDCQNRKLCAVAELEGFRVAKLRVRQLKIGRKSWFGADSSVLYPSTILLSEKVIVG